MKKYLAVIAVTALFLPSCEKFLTRENPNKIESETYFNNESSLKIYTNGLGRSFATLILDYSTGDIGTDIMFQEGTNLYFTPSYTAENPRKARLSGPQKRSSQPRMHREAAG